MGLYRASQRAVYKCRIGAIAHVVAMTLAMHYSTSVASSSRPFYGTIWFNLAGTALIVLILFWAATSLPDIEGRPVRSIGQFGVVLVGGYWVFIFPKLRKMLRDQEFTGKDTPPPEK